MYPKISIVTINRNNSVGLKKTIESVLAQKYINIEYIIIDGNSNDASVSEIKAYEDRLAYWVSEPDKGLYNAMNKGLSKASGEYVLFLNSADYLYDDKVLDNLVTFSGNKDVIYGNLGILKGENIQVLKSAPVIHYHKQYQHNLPPHPATLIKRQLLNELGGFDEKYRIIADVVLISKVFSSGSRSYRHLDIPVTVFDMNGVSSHPFNQERIYNERRKFIQEQFPQYLADFESVYKKGNFLFKIVSKCKRLLRRF